MLIVLALIHALDTDNECEPAKFSGRVSLCCLLMAKLFPEIKPFLEGLKRFKRKNSKDFLVCHKHMNLAIPENTDEVNVRVKIMFRAVTMIILMFLEGQKRIKAMTHAETGMIPTENPFVLQVSQQSEGALLS